VVGAWEPLTLKCISQKLFEVNMRRLFILAGLLVLASMVSAQEGHFIKDAAYRTLVHEQYLKRRDLARGRDKELFGVMERTLTAEQTETLEFLYAFMPLSDLANLDGEYFLGQVNTSLEARHFFSWGKTIPEDIFRHFVLPYRVNNENPDTARQVFFRELKNRIKGLSMYEAALEVNHWCHEKVTYRATDERTSAPLATIKTAFGRCGEESVFTVAALRSVGIPARQVYTPRWAHTDDNHAWVEVWADGRWYFMGACEPEPELNMAWFTGPAKRAMMVNTTVFGQYSGPEEILMKTSLYTKINQLPIYAPSTKLLVIVKDTNSSPIQDANVDFCLYNSAEFYPVATKTTDTRGEASVITGLGDMVVWASKDGQYALAKISVGNTDTLILTLREPEYAEREVDLYIIPPVARSVEAVNQAKAEDNNRRLGGEDTIREAYVATFIDSASAAAFAKDKGFSVSDTWRLLHNSRGNWKENMFYLSLLRVEEAKNGFDLLEAITEKDLHDTPASILLDHLRHTLPKPEELDQESYMRFVLSPRIGRELITPWRSFIQQSFSKKQMRDFRKNPSKVADWINGYIKPDQTNYYSVPLSPKGVMQLGLADTYSKKVLFVAICRSLGIPAKISQANGKPGYLHESRWMEIAFDKEIASAAEKSKVALYYDGVEGIEKPGYYTRFTLARLENGRFKTLDYENDPSVSSFPCQLTVDAGYYMLVTGNRQSDGSVLCHLQFFMLPGGSSKDVHLTIRNRQKEPEILGHLKADATFSGFPGMDTLKLSSFKNDEGLIVFLIEPDKEPTKHLMEEIQALQEPFSQWRGALLFVVAKDKIPAGFSLGTYHKLPVDAIIGYDGNAEVASAVRDALGFSTTNLPVVIVCRKNGEIIMFSEGYHIGTGEQLLKTLRLLE